MPHLLAWLNVHPYRKNPQAYLWGLKGEAYTYSAFRQMLRKVVQRSKIKKSIWPYLMRHSSITDSADSGLTEAELDDAYGWTQGSKSPRTYVHLAGRSVKKAMLRRAGIAPPEQAKYTVRLCPRCKKPVANKDMDLCPSCGSVISPKAALTIQDERNMLKTELESLKGQMKDLERHVFLIQRRSLLNRKLSDEKVDQLMKEEEEALQPLREAGLLVTAKNGKLVPCTSEESG